MDLNIEGTGEVMGWSPPIGDIMSPGFTATMKSLQETFPSHGMLYDTPKVMTKRFIDKLEQKGYCIAKFDDNAFNAEEIA